MPRLSAHNADVLRDGFACDWCDGGRKEPYPHAMSFTVSPSPANGSD